MIKRPKSKGNFLIELCCKANWEGMSANIQTHIHTVCKHTWARHHASTNYKQKSSELGLKEEICKEYENKLKHTNGRNMIVLNLGQLKSNISKTLLFQLSSLICPPRSGSIS